MDANYALEKLEEYAKYGLAYNKRDLAALPVWVRKVITTKPLNKVVEHGRANTYKGKG